MFEGEGFDCPVVLAEHTSATGSIAATSASTSTMTTAGPPIMPSASLPLNTSVLDPHEMLNYQASHPNADLTDARDADLASKSARTITVHRSKIIDDMLAIFSDNSIMSDHLQAVIIDSSGKEEKGRGSGVLREVFSSFWKESYDSIMIGEAERVPYR